jgi:prepilin-type N-terminal cleavage/methylation domain-containing protein
VNRRGLTLVEIMVVIAIMAVVMAVSIPAVGTVLEVQKTGAAKDITRTYRHLRDEATLRNTTFRIAYDLDNGQWWVEAGDPDALIFMNPEQLQEYEERKESELASLTEREQDAMSAQDDQGFALFDIFSRDANSAEGGGGGGGLGALFGGGGGSDNAEFEDPDPGMSEFDEQAADNMDMGDRSNQMGGLEGSALNDKHVLPKGMQFVWIYSQQYGGKVSPEVDWSDDERDPPEPGTETIVYTYIFPDGRMEHAVLRLADIDDWDEGYTIVIEPLSGRVYYETEELDPEDVLSWLPEEGPEASITR